MVSILDKIIKLGDPRLYEVSDEVSEREITMYEKEVDLMHQLILAIRDKYNFGRGIAAPQIGLAKRIVCLNLEKKHVLYNPVLSEQSDELFELWDDCMSFPNLLVKVKRHKTCTLTFRDENWEEQVWKLDGALSELLQHEVDHLDGILATQRAVDSQSFKLS